MNEDINQQQKNLPDDSKNQRENITRSVVRLSVGGTIVIAIGIILIIILPSDTSDKKLDFLKYGIGVLLPLWGTWMGTVMAYYFSKDNFDAASKSVEKLVNHITTSDEKLASIMSKDVMIPISEIKSFPKSFPSDKTKNIDEWKIVEILEQMKNIIETENRSITRLPIFDENNKIKHIIHENTFDKYLVEESKKGKNIKDLTFKDLKESDYQFIKSILLNGFFVVSVNSNLKEAQNYIDKIDLCKDVFVTENGKTDEPILGWITDTRIMKEQRI
jgi:hypothetical protein